jgi:hypothetical protein
VAAVGVAQGGFEGEGDGGGGDFFDFHLSFQVSSFEMDGKFGVRTSNFEVRRVGEDVV